MPSNSYRRWKDVYLPQLDEIVAAHAAVGGGGPGRRFATMQLNHAYAVMVSSQFQRYCRDLHTEATDHLCAHANPDWASRLLRAELTRNRKLDRGNPNPGTLGSDFERLGLRLWPTMNRLNARTDGRKSRLDKLCQWRNAIAHQDFTGATLGLGEGRTTLWLTDVKDWRKACEGLASTLDRALHEHLTAVVGHNPWQ